MKGIILHGGSGTRLRPLTHTGSKQLIPVANKPISQYVLEDLVKAGIKEVAIVLGNTYPEKIKDFYGDGSNFGANISYVYQGEPKGIAHAVGLCSSFIADKPFVVYLGDNIVKYGIRKFTDTFKVSSFDAMILLCQVENPQRFGVAKFDENGKLLTLIEKPKEPPSNYALTGIYYFKPTIFEMIRSLQPSSRGELEITEAIQQFLDNGYSVGYKIVEGWWKDTGTPEDILEANRLILDELQPKLKSSVRCNGSIQGKVSLGSNVILRQGAMIRGPTIVGKNSVIESGVYIGPYTSIGNYVTIRRGEIENSVIMDHCLINVNERIVDSLIAPSSKIISNRKSKPTGRRFIVGEMSHIEL